MSEIKNASIIIEKVGNGYQIRPSNPSNKFLYIDVYVFQDKGFVSTERESQKLNQTLFGWLDEHFTDNNNAETTLRNDEYLGNHNK